MAKHFPICYRRHYKK